MCLLEAIEFSARAGIVPQLFVMVEDLQQC